jgi:polyphosphate kinase 2 (PPK2 family)
VKINSNDFRVHPGKPLKLSDRPTVIRPYCKSKKHYHKALHGHIEELSSLQHLHFASNRYALLLIFQGIDAAGKDGVIRHVMSGVNPEVAMFTASSSPARRNWSTTSFGARHADCLSVDGSASSIAPTTKKS